MTKRAFLSILLVFTLVFGMTGAVCAEPIKNIVLWQTSNNELEGFLVLNSERAADLNVASNLYSALLEIDNKGRLCPAVAKEWGTTDGGLTWTFKLRDDVVWVDVKGNEMAKCTAQDWLTAMEWVLNFHKNGANNTSMFIDLVKGAGEYYDYTKALSTNEAVALEPDNTKFKELVGIESPDDYTLVYHCSKNAPYFDTLCTSACFYPVSRALIDKLGADKLVGMTNEEMWCNGAYTLTGFIQNNEKIFTRNPKYWDKDAKLFDTVTVLMISDAQTDDQLFETSEVDQCDLQDSNLRMIWNDPKNPLRNLLVEKRPDKYAYHFYFNYAKNNPDGTVDTNWNTAVANENFRKSLYYGLDFRGYWSRNNFIYPEHCENVAYTMKGLLYFSDGTDYVEHIAGALDLPAKKTDGTPRRLDPERAAAYKAKAMEELKAKGVTFPVKIDYYIQSGSQTALDTAVLLKEAFEALGTDYITFNTCTYVSSPSQEVVSPRLQSVYATGWGADYGDPENFLAQNLYGTDKAFHSRRYTNINTVNPESAPELIATYKEFTELVGKASAIYDDLDARYQAFVDAEVYFLNHAIVIPSEYNVRWQLTKINDYTKGTAPFGMQNIMYKNWETSTEPYTTAEYDKFRADFEASN